MIRKNILLTILFTLAFNLFSQGETILKIEPDTNIIRIGEQINFTISLSLPKKLAVHFPAVSDSLNKNLELLELSSIDTVKKDEQNYLLEQKFTITSFDTGFYLIPPLPFEIAIGSYIDTLFSSEIPLLILTVPLDTANKIYDIKPQYAMNFKVTELLSNKWFYIILSAIIVLVIIILVLKYMKKENNIFNPQKPQEPAHVIALRELNGLKKEKLWQQNQIKEYYTRLTEIIRNYIESRFGIMAMEKTTSEIIGEFENKKIIDDALMEHLRSLLNMADLIKFAKGSALPDENERNLESTFDFVNKTKPATLSQEKNTDDNSNETEPIKEKENDE